jgi:membrane protein
MRALDPFRKGLIPFTRILIRRFVRNDMPAYSAALAFRILFAMFPFLMFLIAIIGFLDIPEFFEWLREQMQLALPAQVLEMVDPVVDNLQEQRGGVLLTGIGVALWTGSKAVRDMVKAMNRLYDVPEQRPAWQMGILSVGFTIGAAVLSIAAAGFMLLGPQAMSWLASQIGLQDLFVTLWTWLRWPLIVLMLFLLVALIYYFAPAVEQQFRFLTPGALVAVGGWLTASLGFSTYVQNFGNYDAIYGSIGAIIILMLYLYVSSMLLLFGAQLNAVYEHARRDGKDRGERSPDP